MITTNYRLFTCIISIRMSSRLVSGMVSSHSSHVIYVLMYVSDVCEEKFTKAFLCPTSSIPSLLWCNHEIASQYISSLTSLSTILCLVPIIFMNEEKMQ